MSGFFSVGMILAEPIVTDDM